jgi:hypothetical protein
MRWSLLFAAGVGLASACTVVHVSPLDPRDRPTKPVCIERNAKVVVEGFLPAVEEGFRRHGIQTVVYDPPVPSKCQYVLTYTARQSWDIVRFMRYAELRLRDGEKTIGTATYRHRGGFGLNKWASTESKMQRLIDQLLAGFDEDGGGEGP